MNTIEIICTVIGAVATILTGIYFIIKKAVKNGVNEHRLTKVENTVEKLPCGKHHDEIADSSLKYNKINENVISTNEMVSEISKWVMKIDNGMIDALAKKASPLKMTAVGEELFEKSFSKKAIDGNLDFLIKELEKISPKTAFDVEDQAYSVLFKNMGHDLFNEVKNFIYYSPEIIEVTNPCDGNKSQVKISLQTLIRLMGIYLRDKYLEKHTEIK